MRGLVLAMVLVPAALDERIIRAPVDAQTVLGQYLRARAAGRAPLDVEALERSLRTRDGLVRVEPIPSGTGSCRGRSSRPAVTRRDPRLPAAPRSPWDSSAQGSSVRAISSR